MLATDRHDAARSDWITRTRALVDDHLDHMLSHQHPSPVTEAMRYSVLAPGKRIRPLLTLAVSEFLGDAPERALPVACCIEMIHCASLILDDLPCMDDDRERRSRLCTHIEFGESLTILAAVSLLTQSYCTLASLDRLEQGLRLQLVQMLCDTVGHGGLSLGQYIDLHAKGARPTPADITDIHHLKTGVLFMAAARAGCMIGAATPEQERKVMRFTTNMGLAFQLLDDLKDMDTSGANMVTRIGAASAERKFAEYVQAAHAAVEGEPNAPVLQNLAKAFLRKK